MGGEESVGEERFVWQEMRGMYAHNGIEGGGRKKLFTSPRSCG